MKKESMLIFHPVLAPYRIDQFNLLGEMFDLEVVFYLENVPTFKYDQNYLMNQCNFRISHLYSGFSINNRFIRFGILHKITHIKPDYILSYEFSPTTHYLLILKRLGILKQKIGTTIDDSIDICINPQTKARKISRNSIIKKLDFVVLLSKEVAQFYNSTFEIPMDKIILSPILQSGERLRADKEELEKITSEYISKYELTNKKVLLFVGRLIQVKGLKEYLQNILEIIINTNNLKIVMVGEGIEKTNIEYFIKENRLEDKILLPGRFENIDLYPWYLCASGFFLPSTFEPFGAVVNEALIFGLPVLCSKYAGAASLLNSENGIIFDPVSERDTLDKTTLFIEQIKTVEEVSLDSKPSLMDDYKQQLRKEWEKIQNV